MKKIFLLFIFLGTIFAALASLNISPRVFDFAKVEKNKGIIVASFEVHNTSRDIIQIIDVKGG